MLAYTMPLSPFLHKTTPNSNHSNNFRQKIPLATFPENGNTM